MEALCAIGPDGRVHSSGDTGRLPWWSFTKTVLAITALRLVESGAFTLDERIGDEPYTLRQLLQHETGLPDYGSLQDYHDAVARGDEPWSVEELFDRANAERLIFAPGEGWAYSNIGYLKVGQAITVATGESLEAAVRRLALGPAGANNARFASRPADLQDVLMGAARGYHPGWVYHGLIVGPLADAARVLHSLLGGEILSVAMLAEMCRARSLSQFRNPLWLQPAYGLGLMTPVVSGGDRVLGHSGEGPGSTVAVYGVDGINGPLVAGAWSCREPAASVEAAAVERLKGERD
jgi:CubicO group peptidase (beta-lactamase class C family)